MRTTLAILVLSISMHASAAANYSGRWALDAARSEGLPPGLEQTLVIEQNGDTLSVATNMVSDYNDRVLTDVYSLGGAERDFAPQLPGVTAKSAKRTARVIGERSFESIDRIEGEAGGGPLSLEIKRLWTLSDDGKTLTIQQAVTNSGFTTHSKRVLVSGGLPNGPAAQNRQFPVELTVPVAPTAFRSAGKTNLVYELHVTSFRVGEMEWKRLDILGESGQTLASYGATELDAILSRPGTAAQRDMRRIGAGMRAVAYLWIAVDGDAPRAVKHRAAFTIPASASGRERIVEGAAVSVRPQPVVIGPPVRGGTWVARFGGSNTAFHRRGLQYIDGAATISQRFAIDWNRFAADNIEFTGEGTKNTDFATYGQEVIAVADAVVARVRTDLPENTPGAQNPAVAFGLDTAAGNFVSLQLADGTYATYAHLQAGSIAVKEGQRVRRGDVLGRIGNSGNATGPHLHFQIATAPGLEGQGLPYAIESFEVLGRENGPPKEGKLNGLTMAAETHVEEMPAEHMLIRFQ